MISAVLIVLFNTVTQREVQLKVRYSPTLPVCYESYVSRLDAIDVRDFEIAIQTFWICHPFQLTKGIVRSALAADDKGSRLVHIAGANIQNDAEPFSEFYDGHILSSIEPYQQFCNVDSNGSRKKRSFGLLLAYDGQYFCGWQRQPNNLKLPAVQEIIENTIESAFTENGRPDIRASGRTDSGVHALGQIARVRILPHCTINNTISVVTANDVFDALNAAAKASRYTWRCLAVIPVSDKFHPTFDTQTRSYVYILDAKAVVELITTVLSTGSKSNTEAYSLLVQFQNELNTQLCSLVGVELDYYSLSYGKVKTESTLCRLQHAKVRIGEAAQAQTDQMILIFEFTGNRFLRRMVRMLVGTCMELALTRMMTMTLSSDMKTNHMSNDCISLFDICNSRVRTRLVKAAPPEGLIFIGAKLTVR